MSYRFLLFDLFRTVVVVGPGAPTMRVEEPEWRPAMQDLRSPITQLLPGVDYERFLDVVVQVTREIASARPPLYREVSSRERYGRVLERLGRPADADVAEELSRLQMRRLVENCEVPAEHLQLLRDLGHRYPLAMVSNFDHAPTVRLILERSGALALFATVVISDEAGVRKPHPDIFREALRRLDAAPEVALHVGDSFPDDIVGARAAGIATAWLNPRDKPLPAGQAAPELMLQRLVDLPAHL